MRPPLMTVSTGRTTQQLLGLLIVCVVDLTDEYVTVAARSDQGVEKPSDRRLACNGESAHPERTIRVLCLTRIEPLCLLVND